MHKRRTNKVRALLLLFIDKESRLLLSHSTVKINHLLSKDFSKKFEMNHIVTFDNSLVRGAECVPAFHNDKSKERDANSSCSHCHSLIYFKQCVQELGKSFIEERKIDLGSRKLGLKQLVSLKEAMKSSLSVQRYKKSKFALLTKKEQKEQLIRDNFNYLNAVVKRLKRLFDDNDAVVMTYSNVSPFHCNLPIIHIDYANGTYLKEGTSNGSNDGVDWITPFKPCESNKVELSGCFYQTETEACRSVITITPSQGDSSKAENVSSFCFETESAM